MKKNPQLPNVSSPRGAPLGRSEIAPKTLEDMKPPARCFRLRFQDGDYDEGGAYWGSLADVYCFDNGAIQMFTRASSREEAKVLFADRFYRHANASGYEGSRLRWVN